MDRIVLPPALFYGVGVLLVVFGALRAYLLGWKQREPRVGETPDAGDPDDAARAAHSRAQREKQAKRHVTFGIVWVAMGLFLIGSTLYQTLR
jgi:hypothetical protein